MKQQIPAPVMAVVIVAVLLVVGLFLYQGASGGVQGEGKAGNVEAAPPIGRGGGQPININQGKPVR